MMLTALETEQDSFTLSRSGVNHFDNKPFNIAPLLANVARLLIGNS